MEGPTAVMLAIIIIGLPTIMIMLIANRFFKFREKKLEVEALHAAEKAAQYAARSSELEERVRVLEKIVTDGGAQTASQIEALRDPPRRDRKSTRLNSSHMSISYAVFCLKKKKKQKNTTHNTLNSKSSYA